MNRLKFSLDSENYLISNYVYFGEKLFLLLIDENKSTFKGNVICVNNRFEIIHRFDFNESSSISTNQNSLILYCSGYQFYFDPTTFEKQFYEWVK